MISYTSSFIVSVLITGLSPICAMPLVGTMIPLCSRLPKSTKPIQEPRYSDLVTLQTRFESVMESAGLGTNLALDLKNSEMAVRDLNTLVSTFFYSFQDLHLNSQQVKLSDLVAKDLLASSLEDFVSSARDASRLLSRLESGVGGAVDS